MRIGVLRMVLACVAALAMVSMSVAPASAAAGDELTQDVLIFRNGNVLQGEIVRETDREITFRGKTNGIEFEFTYQRGDILEIQRDVAVEAPATDRDAANASRRAPADARSRGLEARDGAPVVYVATLDGVFSEDISVQSVEMLLRDAASYQPDYLVFELDNDWSAAIVGGNAEQEMEATLGPQAFDDMFLVEQMEPMLTELMAREWDKKPELVFWVKNAMGGAAFLPWLGDRVYFHPDGRMGGIGYIERFQLGGDRVVDEKQISLRVGHAEGLAIKGGHDPLIMRAMLKSSVALSYSIENGEVVLYDDDSGEVSLTVAIEDPNQTAFSVAEHVRGLARDVLNLTAEPAKVLGVSQGTASTLDDVLFELGVLREHKLVQGSGDRKLAQWSRRLDEAAREYERLVRDYADIQVQGETKRERNRFRGQQINMLNRMLRILQRYEGALKWWQLNGGMSVEQINALIEQIRFEMAADED